MFSVPLWFLFSYINKHHRGTENTEEHGEEDGEHGEEHREARRKLTGGVGVFWFDVEMNPPADHFLKRDSGWLMLLRIDVDARGRSAL